MKNLTLSEKYGIAAALGMLLLVLIDNAVVMLIISIIGLVAGILVVRAGEERRVVYVAAIAFALALGLALFALLR